MDAIREMQQIVDQPAGICESEVPSYLVLFRNNGTDGCAVSEKREQVHADFAITA